MSSSTDFPLEDDFAGETEPVLADAGLPLTERGGGSDCSWGDGSAPGSGRERGPRPPPPTDAGGEDAIPAAFAGAGEASGRDAGRTSGRGLFGASPFAGGSRVVAGALL